MKFNKKIMAGCFLAAVIFMSVTVYGEEIKSRNGIMTIEVLDNDWRVTEAETSCTVLTDGENVITMCHFSNGEELPEIRTADEEYAQVCQNIISTKDEVFVITGFAVEFDDFKKVQEAVQSTVINEYGTKKAVKKDENMESNQSVDLEYEFEVSERDTAFQETNAEEQTELVEEHREVFYIGGNGSADIYKAEDGNWYDDFGRCYIYEGEGYWLNVADDTIWADWETLTAPANQNAVAEVNIASEDGLEFDTIYLNPYGVWKSMDGGIFTDNGDNTFTRLDGTIWYTFDN